MGKRSEQTNMANSFPMQVPAPGVTTPNVQGRVAAQPVGAAVNRGTPTQIAGDAQPADAAIAQSPVHSSGGFSPRQAAPAPGSFGEQVPSQPPSSMTKMGSPPAQANQSQIAQALRGRGRGPLEERQ